MKLLKKTLLPMILFALIISMIPAVNADFGRMYIAPYGTPIIDATIDGVWDNAEWTLVDKPHQGTNKSTSIVRVKMLWDKDHIYFLAVIEDNSYNAEYDVFEVYLDQNNKKTTYFENDDSQTRFRLSGSIVTGVHKGPNAQTNAPFKVEKVDYNKYILEGALFYTIGRPRAGDVMGLEFMYNDGLSGQSDMYEAYRWNVDTASGEARPFSSTLNYGILIFADKNGNTQGSIVPQTTTKVTEADTTTAANTTTVSDTTKATDTTIATDTTKTPNTTSKVTTASKNKNKDTTAPSNNENTRDNSIDKALLIALIAAVAVGLTAIVMLSVVLIKLKKKSPKE